MKRLTKKGFTLIELLAVIVVLAVIMLVAVTAVVPMMERAKKQSFITEAQTAVKGAESFYTYHKMTNSTGALSLGAGSMECIDIKNDLMGKYIEEKGKTDYQGIVLYLSGNPYLIAMTDGSKYYLASEPNELIKKDESIVLNKEEMEEKANEFTSSADADVEDFLSCNAFKLFYESY